MHATEVISAKTTLTSTNVIALVGTERFFRAGVLRAIPGVMDESGEISISRFSGAEADVRNVFAELRTVSMFGDQRSVLIEGAEEFISKYRSELEGWVEKPSAGSLLILDLQKWKKTERLYKAVSSTGLIIECSELSGAALIRWMQQLARDEFGKKLDSDTAALITSLAGESLTLLQQEIDKLASLVGDAPEITREDVTRVVGGWKTQTTWDMLDAIRDGHPGSALLNLEKLIQGGEAPQKVLGGLVFIFRRYAEATERARQGTPLRTALKEAGIFRGNEIEAGERYLKRLGFEKASRIFSLLMEADRDMKGGSRVNPVILLERLFIRLAGAPVLYEPQAGQST
jgi:DNA polymerase-3 subunit delta